MKATYEVTGFFSNSNIFPEEEYLKRLAEAQRLADRVSIPLVADEYDHRAWRLAIRGHENAPEKGARCAVCFRFNLSRTVAYARENGFDCFTTTLTISPHKSSQTIFAVGRSLGLPFLDVDFKKGDGFRKSLEKSADMDLYRQNYCGCEFSRR